MKIHKVIDPILQKPMQNSSENTKSQTVLFFVFTIIIVVGIIYFVPRNLTQIKTYIGTNGLWGMLVAVLLYALLGLTLIPSEPLTIFLGALFGPLIATLIAGVGNTLAAIVEYHLGSRVNKLTNFVEKKEKLPLGLGKLPVSSPGFLIFARMIPGYGPKAVSVLAGVYRVPMFLYVWTTAIPTFTGAAIFAFGGFGLGGLVGLFHQ
ncbi:MAG: VTT domain-containing protein [Anaerolineaceae bacterium]|nr:VTT domain-containing protein [Anaerolineaceae bacterium]